MLFDQQVMSDPEAGTHGDCVRACLRTLLQNPFPDAPHPINYTGEGYSDDWLDWLDDNDLSFKYHFRRDGKLEEHLPGILIATGPAIRGVNHAVIYNRVTETIIHDPHPSRAGLLQIEWFWFV